MEHPRETLYKVLLRLRTHFDENRATRIQIGLLALVFASLWWAIGILAGSVLAFFVFFFTPDSPTRAWPSFFAFVGTVLTCGLFGIYIAFKTYSRKTDEMKDKNS